MGENIEDVTDANFEEDVLKNDLLVLVDFWASWCAPCLIIAPSVESLAKKYEGKLKVFKMNVDENMKTPSKYGIRSIPTLLFFRGGELKDSVIGAVGQDKIEEILIKHL